MKRQVKCPHQIPVAECKEHWSIFDQMTTPQHKDTTLDEILADFSDGIAAEQAWVDARQALLQWRGKAVVEALENLPTDIIEADRIIYDVDVKDRIEALKQEGKLL